MKNWKTTLAGAATILTASGSLLAHLSAGDFSTLGTDGAIILAGFIGILAKDNDVTGGIIHQ